MLFSLREKYNVERKVDLIDKAILIVLYVMYTVGIAGHIILPTRSVMMFLTPVTLLCTGGLVLYSYISYDIKVIRWVVVTYIMTLVLEIVGVKTGLIFGSYSYGDTLGLKLFSTPLIIGFNWILVILGSIIMAKQINRKPYFVIAAAPFFAVLFDFILEPVAVKLGYWSWSGNTIPLQNYLAWYIIALSFTIFFELLKIKIRTRVASHYYLIQFTFFMILNLSI